MIQKKDIRRTAYGTCVVTKAGDEAVPCKVTLTLQRRRGCCLRLDTQKVCDFDLHDIALDIPIIGHAFLDLEYLFKCGRKADACTAQIKICVEHRCGQKHVARVPLEEFLGRLFLSGRPDSFFLYVSKGNVKLCQANHDIPKVVPEWPFDGQGKHTHQQVDDDDKCSDTDSCLMDVSKATDINEEISIKGEGHEEEDMTESSEEDEELHDSDDDSGWETFEEDEDDESDEEKKEVEKEMTEINDEEEELEDTDDDSDWESLEEDVEDDEETENREEEEKAPVRVHHDVRKKPQMEMGGVDIFLGGMAATWRHTRRALLIAVVVVLVLAALDMLLPPLDDDDWHRGGGGEL